MILEDDHSIFTINSLSMQFQVMREAVLSQNSVSIASTQTHKVSLECFA